MPGYRSLVGVPAWDDLPLSRRCPKTECTPDRESRMQHPCRPQHDADHLMHRSGIPKQNAYRDVVDEHSAQQAML